jgi:hypothetical protein
MIFKAFLICPFAFVAFFPALFLNYRVLRYNLSTFSQVLYHCPASFNGLIVHVRPAALMT